MGSVSKFKQILGRTKILYNKALIRHPYSVQAVQVSLVMCLGDVLAQTVVEKTSFKNLNTIRTAQFAGMGLFLVGPTVRVWYGILDKVVKTQTPLKRALQKVCLDQICFAPVFVVIFTSTLSKLQGMSFEEIRLRLKANYFDIMKTSYCIWPFVQIVNFQFVPLNYQVMVVQTVAVFWNTYFSWKLAHKHQQQNNKD